MRVIRLPQRKFDDVDLALDLEERCWFEGQLSIYYSFKGLLNHQR